MVDIEELAAEIEADPQGIGYKTAGVWKADEVIAGLINDPNNGALVWRRTIPMADVYAAIDWVDFAALPGEKREAFALITSTESLNTDSVNIQSAFAVIFPAGATLTALIALAHVQGSRAEVLFGEGTTATASDVGHAQNV